jgi:hypothetical protein
MGLCVELAVSHCKKTRCNRRKYGGFQIYHTEIIGSIAGSSHIGPRISCFAGQGCPQARLRLSGAKACLLSGPEAYLSGAKACLSGAEACLPAVCLLSALVL